MSTRRQHCRGEIATRDYKNELDDWAHYLTAYERALKKWERELILYRTQLVAHVKTIPKVPNGNLPKSRGTKGNAHQRYAATYTNHHETTPDDDQTKRDTEYGVELEELEIDDCPLPPEHGDK